MLSMQRKESLGELCCGEGGPFGLPEVGSRVTDLRRNLEEDEMITESDFAFIIFSLWHLSIISA